MLALYNLQQTKCVIKEIDLSKMKDSEQKEAYREAKILESLKHPNIIRFREVYQESHPPKLCIVMDYADAGDLQKRIKANKGKLFPESHILDWFFQICSAVKHVHSMKILHRDIKVQNIFLTKSGKCLLGDFGISRALTETRDYANTVIGTPYYLSPEIIEGRPYKYESDVWALGVLLYELCALRPPFDAPSMPALALKIVRGNYSSISPQFSRELKELLGELLQVDPSKRPSVEDILNKPVIKRQIRKVGNKADRALCLIKARDYRMEKERLLRELVKGKSEVQELMVQGIAYTPIVQPLVKKNAKFEKIRENLIKKIGEKKNKRNEANRLEDTETNHTEGDGEVKEALTMERDTFGQVVTDALSEVIVKDAEVTPEKVRDKVPHCTKSTQETEKTPSTTKRLYKSNSMETKSCKLLSLAVTKRIERSSSNNKIIEYQPRDYMVSEFRYASAKTELEDETTLIRKHLEDKFGEENTYKIATNIKKQVN
eukprot:TRINITY_DN3403_c0_g1_i1.p2 TRINITY_DN3403_c0_g1~~TRINITY_DN3403_c0_g1_i1.p2  ORF type:complete len:489 (-),score=57.36 TRINITY_DN3403_c0_g1_i1:179-1645(-)